VDAPEEVGLDARVGAGKAGDKQVKSIGSYYF